jgi:hypothetical protein
MIPSTSQMSGVTGLRIKRNQGAAIPDFGDIVAGRRLQETKDYNNQLLDLRERGLEQDQSNADRSYSLGLDANKLAEKDAARGKRIQYGLLGLQGLNTLDSVTDGGVASLAGKGAEAVQGLFSPDVAPVATEFAKAGDAMALANTDNVGIPNSSSLMGDIANAGNDYIVDPLVSGVKKVGETLADAGGQAYDFFFGADGLFS